MATRSLPPPVMPLDVRLMGAAARALTLLAGFVLLALALTWWLRQPQFGWRQLRIEGELQRTNPATVRANALPRLAGNFYTLDLQLARRAFESVPWVRQAVVRRAWPGGLHVTLHEHRAVALWQTAEGEVGGGDGGRGPAGIPGEDRLVNEQGDVFEANLGDVEDDQLPTFRGPAGRAAEMLALHRRLAPVVAPIGQLPGTGTQPARISALQLSGRGSWRVELDTGTRLELGRGTLDEVVRRAERVVRTLPQAVASYRRPLLLADARHPEGYAVRLSGVVTAPVVLPKVAPPRPPAPKPRPAPARPSNTKP